MLDVVCGTPVFAVPALGQTAHSGYNAVSSQLRSLVTAVFSRPSFVSVSALKPRRSWLWCLVGVKGLRRWRRWSLNGVRLEIIALRPIAVFPILGGVFFRVIWRQRPCLGSLLAARVPSNRPQCCLTPVCRFNAEPHGYAAFAECWRASAPGLWRELSDVFAPMSVPRPTAVRSSLSRDALCPGPDSPDSDDVIARGGFRVPPSRRSRFDRGRKKQTRVFPRCQH